MIEFLGVIPARGGSKGIHKKNIRLLGGKPLISYTIEAALKSRLLSKLIVSTDDEQIKEVALDYGAEVPFIRPAEYADDNSSDADVLNHCVGWFQAKGLKVDHIVYLRPSTPLKSSDLVDACIHKFASGKYTGLRTVTRVEGVHHPYWMYRAEDLFLKPFVTGVDPIQYFQRQLLPECLSLNGVVDILNCENLSTKNIYGDRIGFHIIDEKQAIDIDTEMDLRYCEYMILNSGLK